MTRALRTLRRGWIGRVVIVPLFAPALHAPAQAAKEGAGAFLFGAADAPSSTVAEQPVRPEPRVKWVDPYGLVLVRQPPMPYAPPPFTPESPEASQPGQPPARGYVFYRGPFGAEGCYIIPEYTGPTLRDGYGKGYDALAYRYGLEESSFRRRFDPFYREAPDQVVVPQGAHSSHFPADALRQRLNREDMTRRAERVLGEHERALRQGLDQLKAGQVERAIVSLTLAAKLNQSDAASRIHLAQARLAQGTYVHAAKALRRALELQPKLLYLTLPLDSYYAERGALGRYTEALSRWLLANHEVGADEQFLLGFLELQRDDFDSAHAAFQRAAALRPGDELTRDALAITRTSGR